MAIISGNDAKRANKIFKHREPSATYDYRDASEKLLFQVCRYRPKGFRQRAPKAGGGWQWSTQGVEKVLYRLPEIMRDIKRGLPIFICEGEKDVLAMVQHGFSATCNPGGASKWCDSFSEVLRAADVVIIADKDDAGREHAQRVAAALHGISKSVRVLELPNMEEPVKDAFDFFYAGGTAKQIQSLVAKTPVWRLKRDLQSSEFSNIDFPSKSSFLSFSSVHISSHLLHVLQDAIESTVPNASGQNHYRLFDLARKIKALEKENAVSFSPIELKHICKRWCECSQKFLRHRFDSYFFEFLGALEAVRYPAGEKVLLGAWERAQKITSLPEWEILESEKLKLLTALCRELQICAGDHSYILPVRVIQSLFKLKRHETAWRWLEYLCRLKILKKVKAGSSEKRQPNEYRYLPTISIPQKMETIPMPEPEQKPPVAESRITFPDFNN